MVNNMKTIFLALITLMFLASGFAYAGDYADSAHGNTGYGVDRTSTSQYTQGHCAHCHEQHASIAGAEPAPTGGPDEFLLFAANNPTSQTANFCFQCHCNPVASKQSGMIENKDYGSTFGGGTATFTNIYDAFNPIGACASSHDLATLLTWVEANHPEWGFTSNSNPCTICHNPHIDRRNRFYPRDPTYTAIRRPSEHASNPTNQWGDDTGETMDSNWSAYQAPYYQGGNYEPDGTTSTDGSKHPDYSTLCLDCHSERSVNGRSGIDWRDELPRPDDTWVPIHGEFVSNAHSWSWFGNLKLPWVSDENDSYDSVLSCLDCHEPHGSSNPHMLRTTVNGVSGLTYDRDDNDSVQAWCEACHVLNTLTQEQEDFCRACHVIGSPGSVAEVYDNGSPLHFSFVSKPKCIDCHTHAPNIVYGPHGNYEPDSDACAQCHRARTR